MKMRINSRLSLSTLKTHVNLNGHRSRQTRDRNTSGQRCAAGGDNQEFPPGYGGGYALAATPPPARTNNPAVGSTVYCVEFDTGFPRFKKRKNPPVSPCRGSVVALLLACLPVRNLACEYRDLVRLRALSTQRQPAGCFLHSPTPVSTTERGHVHARMQHAAHPPPLKPVSTRAVVADRSHLYVVFACVRVARLVRSVPRKAELAPAERAAPPHAQHGCAAAPGGGCLTVPYSTGDHLQLAFVPRGPILYEPFEVLLFEGKLSLDPHEGMGMRVEPSLSRRARLP